MNIAKRFFYRTFQKMMHILIPFFPYREPKLLNEIEDIIEVLKAKNIKNVMLVTGKRIRGSGLTKPLEMLLEENNILSMLQKLFKEDVCLQAKSLQSRPTLCYP